MTDSQGDYVIVKIGTGIVELMRIVTSHLVLETSYFAGVPSNIFLDMI